MKNAWLKIANFAAFQVGWFACILAAAAGRPWIGPAAVAAIAAAHLSLVRRRRGEAILLAVAAALGYAMDSALVLGGILEFPEAAQLGAPTTVWMVALWVNLAMTLHVSLAWLMSRPALCVVLGAVAGPLTYYAGARLGAVELGSGAGGLAVALGVIGIEWAVAMPLLAWIACLTGTACPATLNRTAPA